MTTVLRLYLKVFLIMGIPFGVLMMLLDLMRGIEAVLFSFVLSTIFFGGFMSLTLVTWHILRLRRMGIKSFDGASLHVSHTKALQIPLTQQELIDKIQNDAWFGKMKISTQEDTVELTSGPSFYSWGEKIRMQLDQSTDHISVVRITSKPLLSTTVIDFGKNKVHVDRLEQLLLTDSDKGQGKLNTQPNPF